MGRKSVRNLVVVMTSMILITGCRKRDAILPDSRVVFESSGQNMVAGTNSITIKVKLSRGTDRDIPVTINLNPLGVSYGVDFTTTPAAVSNSLSLTIPSGNSEASFTVQKNTGILFDGDEKLILDIYSSGAPVLIGATKQFTLNFGELVAGSTNATIDGGGVNFPNRVYIDLSANRHTLVLRTNWDLGFYTGADDHRVILNSSSAMMARSINKTDLNQVSGADTLGLLSELSFNQFAPTPVSLPFIDYPNGDLNRTAIAQVSVSPSDNKVYLINRGNGVGNPAPARGWKKVRILRNAGGGYTLQHADIAATSFTSVDIPKDETYYFKYISFENGLVNVEPAKKKWDLAWTYFSNVTNFGAGEVPYLFQDIIIQNRNVSAVKVMIATRAFSDFDSTHIGSLVFSSLQTAIGSDWRSGGGPTSGPAVRTDRFYIIRDGDNNYYKLRFTSLTQAGVRGYPSYEAVLIKRGI